MSVNHDLLADKAGRAIIKKIVTRENDWGQVFSNNIKKAGDFSWPRPDYVCFDFDLEQSLAFEFKPPNHSKREYLTGLGQTLAYLDKHHYAGLILPTIVEGYNIAEHISRILSLDIFAKSYITVVGYDERLLENDPDNAIKLFKRIEDERTGEFATDKLSQTYWCWWRDMSQFEVFNILTLLDKYSENTGDVYTEHVWPEFWQLMIQGKTKNWEGKPRDKADSPATFKSEKQNYKIPLFQLGLIEPSEGRLTAEGYKLLAIGKIFGVDSNLFIDYLTKLVLIEGKHLILIQDLYTFEDETNPMNLSSQEQFRLSFEQYLSDNNSIGPRKPGRTTTGNKISYIRDEFKLWNKLGLLRTRKSGYFIKGKGVEFNWKRITDILTKEFI